jgi:poly-gamma-glutamate synthesis protein (capsule biosynthesis protein)
MRTASLVLACALLLPARCAAQPPLTLRISFIGDIMAHDVNYRMGDYTDIWRNVADIFQADDLTVANLELPVDPTRPLSTYPLFNGSPAYVRAAIDAGVDVFSLANNHAFDGGEEGIFQTLRSIASLRGPSRPFWVSGIRGNPRQPFHSSLFVVNGARVGFLALTQFLNVPGGGRYVNVVDDGNAEAVEALLNEVRQESRLVDLLIVSYHGDEEYVGTPSGQKERFFHGLLEAGAGIVFSHHPHVVQGYELVDGARGTGLIMYSMGNFISGMTWQLDPLAPDAQVAATGESYILQAAVRCGAAGCSVENVGAIPIANFKDEKGEMVVARLSSLADGSVALSAAWRSYYAGRLKRMEKYLSGSAARSP